MGETRNHSDIIINNIFAFQVTMYIMRNYENQEPQIVDECQKKKDWPKWKETIQTELNSLAKWKVFGPVAQTPRNIKLVGYKWVFVRKRNKNDEIIRYKARGNLFPYNGCNHISILNKFNSLLKD